MDPFFAVVSKIISATSDSFPVDHITKLFILILCSESLAGIEQFRSMVPSQQVTSDETPSISLAGEAAMKAPSISVTVEAAMKAPSISVMTTQEAAIIMPPMWVARDVFRVNQGRMECVL